tara:strand:+ start:1820 stop:2413 length:594 start_codon:yes stop_codon:yes gene_type:complete
MSWQKISDTHDLISYEKNKEDMNIRIEARLNKDRTWSIYKTYFEGDNNNFIDEHKASNISDARKVVDRLLEEKDLNLKEINEIKAKKSKALDINLKRAFKEGNIEKWHIYFNSSNVGFLNIRYSEKIEIDLVVDENFRFLEKQLLEELNTVLGLTKISREILFNNYYFAHHSHKKLKSKKPKKLVLGNIEIGMDFRE